MANELTIIVDADIDGLRRSLEQARRETESFANRIGDIGADIAKLGAAISAGITLPIVALGKASIQAYGEIQALQKGLEAAAGSASYAEKQFEDLKEVAKLPGLGLKEATKGSINLQAIGLSAGKAEKVLLEFGNAVASVGKGRVEFERAIYGISQLANTQFPLGEDLNIIADALPQVRTLLSDTFGSSRSDDLKKMGVTSKEILDVILNGLEKLPRVNGGIKNAFENLGDSIQQNLSRIGKVIDDRLNISGLIDKLTSGVDSIISKFEDLSQPVQEIILIFTGLVAISGPVLLGLGGIMAILPTLANGFNLIRGAVIAFNTALLTNPYLAAGAAILSIISVIALYRSSLETVSDRQEKWNDTLLEAGVRGRNEVKNLEELYKKTQDHKISLEERNKAVDQIQKQYPYYFGNLSNEAVLAGQAANAYNSLRKAILNASLARAAQKELDKRTEDSLQKELLYTKRLKALYRIAKSDNEDIVKEAISDYENLLSNTDKLLGGVANPFANSFGMDRAQLKEVALNTIKYISQEFKSGIISSNKENSPLIDLVKKGYQDIENLDMPAPDKVLKGVENVKKETDKQLSEIFPVGSIAELQQRADLLRKALETSVDGKVKIRGLDKFGKETNKQGLPYFTGEILSLEEGFKRLEQLNAQIDLFEPKTIKEPDTTALKSFRDTLVDFSNTVQREGVKIGEEFFYFPEKIAFGIDKAKVEFERLKKLTKDLNKDFNDLVNSSISNGLTDLFSSIGQAIGEGGNVIASIGNSLLGAFGGFLSDMGKMLIEYGTLAIAKGTLDLIIQTGGYQAIAAGIAAIAVGAALSIAGGALGSRAKGGMQGGVSTQTGGSTGNNYTSSYTSGASQGGDTIYLRLEGRDLVTAFNRNVALNDRVNAG